MHLPSAEFILCLISGSRGSRHSTDSGATSDSGEARDTMYDELSSPFRSDIETSPPVSPTSLISFQKGAYISKVKAESTHLLNGGAGREIIWLWVRKYVPSATRSSCDDREPIPCPVGPNSSKEHFQDGRSSGNNYTKSMILY